MGRIVHVPPQIPEVLPVKIAFVGEAPSDEETAVGRPFVGPSGRVLNMAFRAANLTRAEYHITNLFDEQAEDNNVAPWLQDEGRLAAARERLAAEFAVTRPNLIVPLGGSALYGFTGYKNITTFRGSITRAEFIVPGAKLLPTYHPAAVFKQWKMLTIVIGDILKAAREAERGPQIVYPKRELLIEPTIDEVEAFVPQCLASDLLSVDIETGWGGVTCIGFAPTHDRAMCVPFVDKRRANRNFWPSADLEFRAWKAVQTILESPVPKLGQNYVYDFVWLYEECGIGTRNYSQDTRLMSHALYPELPKDLATLAGSYTQVGAWKQYGGHYHAAKRDS